MKLKTLKIDSDVIDYMKCFEYNSNIIGNMSIRQDIYIDFIKILTAFPLKDNKLEYFLKLSPESKVGYMSKYIMKLANTVSIPKSVIEYYFKLKGKLKVYNKTLTPQEIGELYNTDVRSFFNEYSTVIKKETYVIELSDMTKSLCLAILEQYDKARNQLIKDKL
jgi:hypothetical protein